jgi:hypothetical protein
LEVLSWEVLETLVVVRGYLEGVGHWEHAFEGSTGTLVPSLLSASCVPRKNSLLLYTFPWPHNGPQMSRAKDHGSTPQKLWFKKNKVLVKHSGSSCNLSYKGGGIWENHNSRAAQAKMQDPPWKK